MCRWLAYFGDPIRPEELLYEPRRSLIEQSRRSGPDANIANADGFGLGWYGLSDAPGLELQYCGRAQASSLGKLPLR